MSVSVQAEQISINCNRCGTVTFTVNRADMTETEWIYGAKARLIREAGEAGWTGGRHSLTHLCPACSAIPEG